MIKTSNDGKCVFEEKKDVFEIIDFYKVSDIKQVSKVIKQTAIKNSIKTPKLNKKAHKIYTKVIESIHCTAVLIPHFSFPS